MEHPGSAVQPASSAVQPTVPIFEVAFKNGMWWSTRGNASLTSLVTCVQLSVRLQNIMCLLAVAIVARKIQFQLQFSSGCRPAMKPPDGRQKKDGGPMTRHGSTKIGKDAQQFTATKTVIRATKVPESALIAAR